MGGIFRSIDRLSLHPHLIRNVSKYRSFSLAFAFTFCSIALVFIVVPTLILHHLYVPHWSLIELTYFTITTNHLIGFGDLMPCADLHGQNRSTCSTIMTSKNRLFVFHRFILAVLVYVIVQVLTAGLLSHLCWIYPSKRRQYFSQRRHSSDPFAPSSQKVFFDLT